MNTNPTTSSVHRIQMGVGEIRSRRAANQKTGATIGSVSSVGSMSRSHSRRQKRESRSSRIAGLVHGPEGRPGGHGGHGRRGRAHHERARVEVASTGRPRWKPCTRSQPQAASASDWAALSTPSATGVSPSVCAICTIARTSSEPDRVRMSFTNDISIFSMSTGNCCR